MMFNALILVILVMLVAVGYRRSMPAGAVVGWRDRVWVASAVIAVAGMGLIGFTLGRSGLPWPDNAIASTIIAIVAFTPLAVCQLLGLTRQAR